MLRRSLAAQVALILVATFLLSGLAYSLLYHRFEHDAVEGLMLSQSKVLFRQIQLTRHWNSNYGGVYVLKRQHMQTNPYLYEVGPKKGEKADIRPEITDLDGHVYTLKNPALMARELSELSSARSDIRYHLTSLKPINPGNSPDAFEQEALEAFENGTGEWFGVEGDDERFRYMAPLKVEKSCLKCHGFQGYKLDGIRGGLAISLPMKSAIEMTQTGRMITIAGGVAAILSVLLVLWILLKRLILRPIKMMELFASRIGSVDEVGFELPARDDEIGRLSRVLATTEKEVRRQQQELLAQAKSMDYDRRHDQLTGLHNRRHLHLEGEVLFALARREGFEVSVMILDIDHFKEVNASHGHAAGDKVLVEIAQILLGHSRIYDLLVRFETGEFAIVVQHCNTDEANHIADRFRKDVAELKVQSEAEVIQVTCSIGVCSSRVKELEQMILAATEATYKAKADGRNRVCHSNQ